MKQNKPKTKIPKVRKYDQKTIALLFGKSAGHCTICNRPVCHDKLSHQDISTAEKAHIIAFSDLGPRADKKLRKAERDQYDNLILLCSTCHTTIDTKIGEGVYTVDWLKTSKQNKENEIMKIMKCLDPIENKCIKYLSPIENSQFVFNNKDLLKACFENKLFVNNDILDIGDNFCKEDPKISISTLKKNVSEKLTMLFNSSFNGKICVFALAPQYLLIQLGYELSDKNNYVIFTKHRNAWIYNETKSSLTDFTLKKPKINTSNKVVLVVSSTARITKDRIIDTLGEDVDIWEIMANNITTDNISTCLELDNFQALCSSTIDKIGEAYGKNKEINIFPAMCNSLAIKFGQSIFHKSHNKITIFDRQSDMDYKMTTINNK